MSLFNRLLETYETCCVSNSLPLYHKEVLSPYEIAIDLDGNFVPGSFINEELRIVIPYSMTSITRVGGEAAPHPLFDAIENVAYSDLMPNKKDLMVKRYIEQLGDWAHSEYSTAKLQALYKYAAKNNLHKDIITSCPKLTLNSKAIVRIRVIGDGYEERTWEDKKIRDSWVKFYTTQLSGERGLCYLTGASTIIAQKAPKVIGNAKIFSSLEGPYIRYTGDRFKNAGEACSIGALQMEKMHNALAWAMSKQKISLGKNVFYIAFSTAGKDIPLIGAELDDDAFSEPYANTETGEIEAMNLRKALHGYKRDLSFKDNIVIAGFEAATDGRLSVIYYSECNGEDLIMRLNDWYTSCVILRANPQGIVKYYTPSPNNIAKYAFGLTGGEGDKKQLHSIVQRLIPCVVEKRRIPMDVVNAIVQRVSKPFAQEEYEYNAMLNVAAAVIRKHLNDKFGKEKYLMGMDQECVDRNYLFGRLLAYAKHVEGYALYKMGQKRETMAERMMLRYAKKPLSTYKQIFENLNYYFKRIENRALAHRWQSEMNEIASCLSLDTNQDAPLTAAYILGFQAQLVEFETERQVMSEKEN